MQAQENTGGCQCAKILQLGEPFPKLHRSQPQWLRAACNSCHMQLLPHPGNASTHMPCDCDAKGTGIVLCGLQSRQPTHPTLLAIL